MSAPANPPSHIAAELARRERIANDWYDGLERSAASTLRLYGMTRERYVAGIIDTWGKLRPLTLDAGDTQETP